MIVSTVYTKNMIKLSLRAELSSTYLYLLETVNHCKEIHFEFAFVKLLYETLFDLFFLLSFLEI